MALGSIHPLTEMNTKNISGGGGKGSQCVGLPTLPPSCADYIEIRSLNLLEPSGPVQACNGIACTLYTSHGMHIQVYIRRGMN